MAKKSIQPILKKQQQDTLDGIAGDLKETLNVLDGHTSLLTNISTTLKKSVTASNKHTTSLSNIEKIANSLLESLTQSKEDKAESDRAYAEQTALLKSIAINTVPKEEKEVKPEQEQGFGPLGLLTGLAAAIGSVIGVITAWVENVKLFTPEFLKKSILSSFEKMGKFFESTVESVIGVFRTIAKSIKAVITNEIELMKIAISENSGLRQISNTIKEMFSGESKLSKVFTGLKNVVTKFAKPFEEAFTVIKGLLSGPISMLSNSVNFIFEGISKFAKAFGFISKIIGKLALPLMVIMTVWDTVKGALEGYDKGGIMGAIEGAITGFLDSLVGGVLDIIKDIASWALDKLGFEDASKWLDSFSFSKMIEDFVDAIFHPIELIKKLINDMQIAMVESINDFIEGWNNLAPDALKIAKMDVPAKYESPTKETKTTGEQAKPETKQPEVKPVVSSIATNTTAINKNETQQNVVNNTAVTEAPQPQKVEKPKSGVEYLIPLEKVSRPADTVYNKSNENVEAKENIVNGGNVSISAPTVNTSNKTVQNQSVKLPTRNPDTTSNRYVTSRYAVQ